MGYNIDEMKTIDTSASTFEKFIKGDLLYVDKSEYAYALLSSRQAANFRFMARPRRFGKTLFVSMLEVALEGRKELFEGLYLGKSDYDFHPYPVIHLDMSNLAISDGVGEFRASLNDILQLQARRHGLGIDSNRNPGSNLANLLVALSEKTGEQVAILIDEYDSPLTSSLGVREGDEIRLMLREFYARIKPNSDRIHFLFITGITRFSNQSIFSKLNNLKDMTFDGSFATAFGYTQSELERYFEEGIDESGLDRSYLINGLRYWYDGYRFADKAEKVYNPVSINSFFSDSDYEFRPYWAKTATASMVVDLAKRNHFAFTPDELVCIDESTIWNFLIESFAPGELLDSVKIYGYLYMTGYLTLDHKDGEVLYLRMPNHEVEKMMTGTLADAYVGTNAKMEISRRIKAALEEGDIEKLAGAFDDIIHAPTYDMRIDMERFYQALIYDIAYFSEGVEVHGEEHTAEGRADIVLSVKGRAVIVELKVNSSAEEALKQIEDRAYMKKYTDKGYRVVLLGVNISTKGRKKPLLEWNEKRI